MDVLVRHSNDDLARTFLTREEIMARCPLAFAETPTNPELSNKYVLANTATVIDDMAKLGWQVVEAKQRKARKGSSGRFSFHMVIFQNPNVKIVTPNETGEEVVEAYPRIILTNSHDGLNCFKFMAGLLRLVCSNGLVICTHQMVDLKIRHIDYSFDELRETIQKAVSELPGQVEIMNEMKSYTLSVPERLSLALQMLAIRKNQKPSEIVADNEQLERLLEPVRDADKGNTLWNVYNVLQEKFTKGGYQETTLTGRTRTARPVNSFVRDLYNNKAYFETAVSFLPNYGGAVAA